MEYQYVTTTDLRANYVSMQPNDNLVRAIPLNEVESFTVAIDKYIKFFGADRVSRLERNLNCCFKWEDAGVILVHRKLHYTPRKWWQFWKKKKILAVTLEVR